MQVTRTEEVPVKRLDGVLDACLAGIPEPRVFLKMDTQGYDLLVVEGAGTRLGEVLALQSELAVLPIYEGMSTDFTDAIAALRRRGFEVSGLFPVNRDPRNGLCVVEFDCVMCRPSAVDRGGRASQAT
jgi:hypothetical protein